jgi:hypothetical protein
MSEPIHITGIPRPEPDIDRFVAALLGLALARLEELEKADEEAHGE